MMPPFLSCTPHSGRAFLNPFGDSSWQVTDIEALERHQLPHGDLELFFDDAGRAAVCEVMDDDSTEGRHFVLEDIFQKDIATQDGVVMLVVRSGGLVKRSSFDVAKRKH